MPPRAAGRRTETALDAGQAAVPQDDAPVADARPPADFETVCAWELHSAAELSTLRARLMAALTSEGHAQGTDLDDVPHRLVLIASELATNAIEHGLPPTTVTLSRSRTEFLLEVTDHDLERSPVFATGRGIGEGGIGMYLTRRLSEAMGWYHQQATKTVWATFPRHVGRLTPPG
ncbi:ATP-binding protein [Luteimicrobium sp. NPDC057192]|uniref:ATP-binding protein n=1 Tax=Luteimicrobium sp. NPDC057192 TaxID=3346042 RepID=UPI003639394A